MADNITVSALGHKGDGVAETGNGRLFVRDSLPGEVFEVLATDKGRVTKSTRITDSPDRVAPLCGHYEKCGGCVVQHASDAFVAGFKRDLVAAALHQQGIEAQVGTTITVPAASRRRLTLKAQRAGKSVLLGYSEARSNMIVDLTQCPVAHPALVAALPDIRDYLDQLLGRRTKANVHLLHTRAGIDLGLELPREPTLDERMDAAQMAQTLDLARLWWNDDVLAERRAPRVQFAGVDVIVPPRSFLQATEPSDQILGDAVSQAVAGAKKVADLFAGLGTLSFPVARHAHVTAFDSEGPAIAKLKAAADRVAGAGDINPVAVDKRDLFRRPLLPAELNKFDAVIIDPPRAGAAAQTEEIAQSKVPVVAAISCNPASFARDALGLIKGGYTLDCVTPLDQFRWSSHVELIARFSR